MVLNGFLKRFRANQAINLLCSAQHHNRVANILEGIEGIGCHIEKPTNADGKGWKIVCDGTSDGDGPPASPLPSGGYQYQMLTKASDDDFDVQWDWLRYVVPE